METFNMKINNINVTVNKGETILEVAKRNNIEIPTLCNDKRVKVYGSCGICVVEAKGSKNLLRSCSTMAMPDMDITTDSQRIIKSRKTALELLLSDHTGDCRPPCTNACPAHTDCQGYVGLIANGEYNEALKVIKESIPLAGSIGKVCPHPCEDACRREMVEEPISIAGLKEFAASWNMKEKSLYAPAVLQSTGKTITIIGGGPGGLACAYFLRQKGHEVTVIDQMPKMGGMLEYGIPEYRLPTSYLQAEIKVIEDMGVTFLNNTALGVDISLEDIQKTSDAVVIAVGAWVSTPLRCEGEELDGVIGGIDFLRHVALDTPFAKEMYAGKKIAVVGGGNTAMDACRTAVRLGADKVYNVYRRTKAEMPAEQIEITEAEEEGVIFKSLTNPICVLGEEGKVSCVNLQLMQLGEADASGRYSPVPIKDLEESLDVDYIIVAIGQRLNLTGLEELELTNWNTINADGHSFTTNISGVFAVGDATNSGPDIAISAIGEAKKASQVIDSYLYGNETPYTPPYLVKTSPTKDKFKGYPEKPREQFNLLDAEVRKTNFQQVNPGFTEEQAKAEANRCLECGCHDYFECQLIDYSNQYDVAPEKFEGEVHCRDCKDVHPFITRETDKCILCGLCVRICDEVLGVTALGLVNRGFDTMVSPALGLPLQESGCISCGQCVAVCPTGALIEKRALTKQVPTKEEFITTTCTFCSVGCQTKIGVTGNSMTRSLPYNENEKDALLCVKGRFGFGEYQNSPQASTPFVNNSPKDYQQAIDHAKALISNTIKKHGSDSVGVVVSPRLTNQEIAAAICYASFLETENIFTFSSGISGLAPVNNDKSTATFAQLDTAKNILLVNTNREKPHLIAGLHAKRGVENGGRLISLNKDSCYYDDNAQVQINGEESQKLISELVCLALENAKPQENLDQLKDYLKETRVSQQAKDIFTVIANESGIIMFEQAKTDRNMATLLGDLALLLGWQIIQLKESANSQGLSDLGVKSYQEVDLNSLKALVVFGEDITPLPKDKILIVADSHLTSTGEAAQVFLPATHPLQVKGSYTNAVGQVSQLNPVVSSANKTNIQLIEMLLGKAFYQNTLDSFVESVRKASSPNPALAVPVKDKKAEFKGSNYISEQFIKFLKENNL